MTAVLEDDRIEIDPAERRVAEALNIKPDIHRQDFIFQFLRDQKFRGDTKAAIKNYYQVGSYSAGKLGEILKRITAHRAEIKDVWTPRTALDFASGYGSVARHIKNTSPHLQLTACDIHPQAISFLRDVLQVDAIES